VGTPEDLWDAGSLSGGRMWTGVVPTRVCANAPGHGRRRGKLTLEQPFPGGLSAARAGLRVLRLPQNSSAPTYAHLFRAKELLVYGSSG